MNTKQPFQVSSNEQTEHKIEVQVLESENKPDGESIKMFFPELPTDDPMRVVYIEHKKGEPHITAHRNDDFLYYGRYDEENKQWKWYKDENSEVSAGTVTSELLQAAADSIYDAGGYLGCLKQSQAVVDKLKM